ncbi:glutaredoxin domain-containing cysteine-rich protein 2 [Macaca nemestrina]|uniref:glutaredoxin domain-containing cysteine-rich protein 2 n=1 Tax=Macaca mulatta TaxID=9544 RepID=UPI0005F434E1|nr:glutaredoxin domain-containing cysteine-rich protein 2 [Macaca mulatta]XP_005558192.2 glutaredoxin domain-containing cysteine-rich protein 2 [Macaca fascicularis]XP_011714453.1 glutaredoxin domain-containing cysteine-rich protein 2 [Macaca nemestrina]XP_050649994.1 glutaredoxin domain-containing cysteine-rich protein 2 [Macaca thibetana thibetana]
MEDPEKKVNQKNDGKPRKVRFKISSSYSGRVLKQVFEDGQELESPKEEYPHSFLQESLEPMDGVYGTGEAPRPREAPRPQLYSPKLTAQRISVFREGNAYTLAGGQPLFNDYKANDHKPLPIIDFGKIIIYTNNLKIIRTPMDKRDFVRKILQKEEEAEEESLMNKEESCGGRDQQDRPLVEAESTFPHNRYTQEGDIPEDSCFHCRGSGSATCSLCHGSKFSMLANRFKESYRALRCPACNENGLQPCQICNQ